MSRRHCIHHETGLHSGVYPAVTDRVARATQRRRGWILTVSCAVVSLACVGLGQLTTAPAILVIGFLASTATCCFAACTFALYVEPSGKEPPG